MFKYTLPAPATRPTYPAFLQSNSQFYNKHNIYKFYYPNPKNKYSIVGIEKYP